MDGQGVQHWKSAHQPFYQFGQLQPKTLEMFPTSPGEFETRHPLNVTDLAGNCFGSALAGSDPKRITYIAVGLSDGRGH